MLWLWKKKHAPLRVPDQFNRNSAKVTALMPPEQSGKWLLNRMKEHLGLRSGAKLALLDFGCGVRFSQAIINLQLPIREYAGVDCFRDMVDFLRANVSDRRFRYHFLDARHPSYHPRGTPLGPDTRLPFPERHYDVASMFSVITHQHPDDAGHIFALLRRHVRPSGHLFFTCFLDEKLESFEDRSPARDGGMVFYQPEFLGKIVRRSGWQIAARFPAEAPIIGDSFACRPA
jgi:SAM-dependent methyltransferase